MLLARRGFLAGMVATLAAPSIVKASSLMPVRSIDRFASLSQAEIVALIESRIDAAEKVMRDALTESIYGDFNMPVGERYGMSGAFDRYSVGDRAGGFSHQFHYKYTEIGIPIAVRLK